MHSRSLKQALRVSVRACIVASAFAGASYADWKSPAYPMAITCLVHDSGAEFLPPSLWHLDTEAPSPEVATNVAPLEPSPAFHLDPVEDCARLAIRLDNQQLALHAAAQAESTVRTFWNSTQAGLASLYQRIAKVWIGGTKSSAGMLASWTHHAASETELANDESRTSEFRGCTISAFEQGIDSELELEREADSQLDCPWERRSAGFDCELNNETAWDRMPSGHNANIFVFTLDSMGPHPSNSDTEDVPFRAHAIDSALDNKSSQPRLSDQIFARDYCVFAPESAVDTPTSETIASTDVVRPSRHAIIQLQRDGSRHLARSMQWLGTAMLRWSSQLESSVRIAEASEGPSLNDRK